jgi:hypothetical protein
MKRVAIVGFAESRKKAPYDDESFEIWALNDMDVPRADRWFEIHDRNFLETYLSRTDGTPHIERLKTFDIPVYMQKHHDDIPKSVEYPLEEYLTKYRDYFTNTVSYMICLAIDEGFDEIHIYGVDMAQNTEYCEQRPSVEYWIGYAEGKGIKVYIPPESDLLKQAYRYGYEDDTTMKGKLAARQEELQGRINTNECNREYVVSQLISKLMDSEFKDVAIEAKRKLNELSFEKIFLQGCLDENKYIKGVFY